MRIKILVLMILSALVLAACGGDTGPQTVELPTATPTLTLEERLEFDPGSIQNPYRMAFVPADTIPERVQLIVATLLDLRQSQVTMATDLSEALQEDAELVELLGAFLLRDFEVEFSTADAEAIETVGGLTTWVESAVKVQAEDALHEYTRLYFELVPVENYGEALDILCNSNDKLVSMSWLDGVTYFAAQSLNCARPSLHDLQIAVAEERLPEFLDVEFVPEVEATPEATDEAATEEAADATEEAADATEEAADATEEADETPEADETEDAESTLESGDDAEEADEDEDDEDPTATPEVEETPEPTTAPTDEPDEPEEDAGPRITGDLVTGVSGLLIANGELSAPGTQAIADEAFCRIGVSDFYSWFVPNLIFERDDVTPASVIEEDDVRRLVDAVADGDCGFGGISEVAFDRLDDEGVTVIETTPPFPYGVLIYPLDVGLGERVNLHENLPLLAENDADSRPLRLLLGQDRILPVEEDAFAVLAAFIEVTGVDLAHLGE